MNEMDPTETFRQEVAELLENLESALLELGQTPQNRELIDTAFRSLHTIKGSGAMFGFDRVAAFTHDFETAFDLIRKGKIEANRDIVTVALAAKDYIRMLIDDPDAADPIIGEAIVADLNRCVNGPRDAPAVESHDRAPASKVATSGWRIQFSFDPDILRNGTNPLVLLDDLRALGACEIVAVVDDVLELQALEPEVCLIKWSVTLASDCPAAAIEDVFMFVRDEMKLEMEPIAAPVAPVETTKGPAAAPEAQPIARATPVTAGPAVVEAPVSEKAEPQRRADDKTATVRVQAERLDELMDRVGELVIAQARLSELANSGTDLAIKSIAEEIERLASGLRDSTMGVRMVPMGSLFGRFRRLVHDLSRDLGKPVDFVTAGEDTELDKTMIERLADPLVHLIRNAIDHGVESPEKRAASGKSATGRIELAARYVGAQVLVTVRDDGAGLDGVRIRAKAEEQGLIAPGATLGEQDTYQLLFAPGFSTAAVVSTLSGRGVGMDVVKRTIEAMRGSIELSTVLGAGTTVTLRLPLTLAIIEGLLIRVGEARYIIPLSAVEECVALNPSDDQRSRGRSFLNIRGDLVPFVRLRELFDAGGPPDEHPRIIIISIGETHVGLVVDQIIGSHQTVIKSLSKLHSDVTMFSGATILGDGSAALIIDVAQLVALAQSRAESSRSAEAA
jgi:two-component system, chemotaxis family, sensor kinase CheA